MSDTAVNSSEDNDINWRFETKYHIDVAEYFALKSGIAPYLKPDLFTQSALTRKYLVRSLYFDTGDYRMYREKIDGDCNRMKFRIRTYNDDPLKMPDIRVEIKVRKGTVMEKYGCFINYDQYLKFMKSRRWEASDDPVLNEFTRYLYKWHLFPKTLVQYYREGFHSRGKEGIRLTFDHQVKSAASKELFPETIYWHRHYNPQIVLEIKHKNNLPFWLKELIQKYDLKVVPNSKYANSIEIAARDLVYGSM